MMDETVHNGHGDIVIVEEFAPTGKIFVGGDDD
jgi:hypothetical protein